MINKTLSNQLELFETIKNGKHLDKNGALKSEFHKKQNELRKNVK